MSTFKIATWNVNSITVRLPHILDWLAASNVDVLAIQETKAPDEKFPEVEIKEAGFHVLFSGQKTYNGVAVISKKPLTDKITDIPGLDDPQRRILACNYGPIHLLNLYVPNGQSLESDKFEYKLHWLKQVDNYVKTQLKANEQLIVLGDFNIAPEDADVHHPEKWEGGILVSEPERKALQKMMKLGLEDCFRLFDQEEKLYSWWDYRAASFRRNHGLRIDLILASEVLAKACKASHIDKEPRTWERPSDHTPVVAEFQL